jgi:hypothetical protein
MAVQLVEQKGDVVTVQTAEEEVSAVSCRHGIRQVILSSAQGNAPVRLRVSPVLRGSCLSSSEASSRILTHRSI